MSRILAAILKAIHESKKPPESKWKDPMVWVTVGLLFVGGLQAWTLWSQLMIQKLEQRAWIAPGSASLVLTQSDNFPGVAKIAFQNTSHQPAFEVENKLWMGLSDAPAGADTDWLTLNVWKKSKAMFEKDASCAQISDPDNRQTVYPSSSQSSVSVENKELEKRQQEIKNMTQVVLFWGCFKYKTEDRVSTSTFCKFLMPERGKDFKAWAFYDCPVGNYAD